MINGIVASFVRMVLSILIRLGSAALTDVPTVFLAVAAFLALSWGIDLLLVIIAGPVLSLVLFR